MKNTELQGIEIYKTEDYDKFKYLTFNREINERHVNTLVEAIERKNLLSVCPCIISSNFEIIDGQHRIEAAKKLKIPFYYFIGDDLSHEDIISLNNAKQAWKLIDYINFYTIKKYSAFRFLSKLIVEHEAFNINCILSILSSDGRCQIGGVRCGRIDLGNKDNFDKIMNHILDYKPYQLEYNSSSFVLALRRLIMGEFLNFNGDKYQYNHNNVLEKLKNNKKLNIPNVMYDNKLTGSMGIIKAIKIIDKYKD